MGGNTAFAEGRQEEVGGPVRIAVGALLILFVVVSSVSVSAMAADYVAMSGKELYVQFCASCHGVEGRGDGPVSSSFDVEVPDLTLIARRQGGKYPRDRVDKIIDGRFIIGAHGTRTMPVWGESFSREGLGDPNAERATRIITGRLADYVWSLQRPPTSENEPEE